MSNPLAIFRKHQKILLVVFGVALMFVFTIGGIISQWPEHGHACRERSGRQTKIRSVRHVIRDIA